MRVGPTFGGCGKTGRLAEPVEQLVTEWILRPADRDIRMAGRRNGGARPTKDMVLRLDPELAERLRLVADVEGRSISDVVREAIATLVDRRCRDKRFRRLLEESLARHQQAIRLLGDDAGVGEDAHRGGVG